MNKKLKVLISAVLAILNFDTIICIPPFDFYVIKARAKQKNSHIHRDGNTNERTVGFA